MIEKFIHLESNKSVYSDTKNTFDTRFILNEPLKKMKKITLKSMELPITFTNIRYGVNDTLTFIVNNTAYSIVILEKNYTTIYDILDALNLQLQPFNGTTMQFMVNSKNQVYVYFTGTLITSFSIVETKLSRFILGFRSSDTLTTISSTSSYIASCRYSMSMDTFITIFISNLEHNNSHNNGSTFKLAFQSEYGQMFFYNENTTYTQFICDFNKNQVCNDLRVKILDRFGNQLISNIDYGMTLFVEMDK